MLCSVLETGAESGKCGTDVLRLVQGCDCATGFGFKGFKGFKKFIDAYNYGPL